MWQFVSAVHKSLGANNIYLMEGPQPAFSHRPNVVNLVALSGPLMDTLVPSKYSGTKCLTVTSLQ
jgi:hypothetical protein